MKVQMSSLLSIMSGQIVNSRTSLPDYIRTARVLDDEVICHYGVLNYEEHS